MWFLSVAVAYAVPPDKQVALLEVGDAQIERFTLSPDGRFLAGRDARENDEGAWVLDLETWDVATLDDKLDDCRVAGIAVRPIDNGTDTTTDDYGELWVGCSDGTLRLKQFEDGVVYDVLQSEDDPTDFSVSIASGLAGVWYAAETDMVYALSFADDDRLVHQYDPVSGEIDAAPGYPVQLPATLGYGSLEEGAIVESATQGTQLVLAHGTVEVSAITLASGARANAVPIGSGIDVLDITPSLQGIYAIDESGTDALYEFIPVSGQWNLLNITIDDINPQAVVANLVPGDEWMVVFGDQIRVWDMTLSSFDGTTPYWESPVVGNFVHDGLAYDGYVYGGGEGGGLRIVTARPWIEPTTVSVSPTAAVNGDDVTVTFTVDEDVDWEIRLNGDRFDPGAVLENGSADAGETVTVTVPVKATDDWQEGVNAVYVVATGADGLTGHAVASVTVDNPPSTPVLATDALKFEDRLLILELAGISDEDLASYRIYVSDEPFTAQDDFGEGETGPSGRINGVKYPLEVSAAPGARVEQWIKPLDNDVPYWVAVRAVDAGGKESEMSRVLTETPRPGLSGAERSGELGGGPCDTGSGAPSLALALAGLVALRRRSTVGVVAVALACAPGAAQAQEEAPEPFWRQHDLGRQYGTFEFRYESLRLEDPGINETYDDKAFGGINFQFGPQWRGIVELDFGVGLTQKKGTSEADALDANGEPLDTAESLLFTMVPLNMDLGLRLKILDEQILVPHVKGGIDYLPWKETRRLGDLHPLIGVPEVPAATGTGTEADPVATADNPKEKLTGWNLGAHYAIGGALLLDVFAPGRASLLEAQTGVNDTYLLVEWRRQVIDNRRVPWKSGGEQGFTFTGSSINVGIKLDF